jgi:hypothetical protein
VPEIAWADTLVAKLPPVTSWFGTPFPFNVRWPPLQVQLKLNGSLSFTVVGLLPGTPLVYDRFWLLLPDKLHKIAAVGVALVEFGASVPDELEGFVLGGGVPGFSWKVSATGSGVSEEPPPHATSANAHKQAQTFTRHKK